MMDFYLIACLLEVLIKLDIASKTLKEYLGWLKMHFSAGLQSFYKPYSKKNGLCLGVHTSGYDTTSNLATMILVR